jgi:hypothetical protein
MILVLYYHLYITYTLADFLFDTDQSNIYRDIQKIEKLIRKCVPIPQKICKITKRWKMTPEEVEKYFPSFLVCMDYTKQSIPRPVDKNKRKIFYYSCKKKRHTVVKNQFWVNHSGFISTKQVIRKGVKMIVICIKRIMLLFPKML